MLLFLPYRPLASNPRPTHDARTRGSKLYSRPLSPSQEVHHQCRVRVGPSISLSSPFHHQPTRSTSSTVLQWHFAHGFGVVEGSQCSMSSVQRDLACSVSRGSKHRPAFSCFLCSSPGIPLAFPCSLSSSYHALHVQEPGSSPIVEIGPVHTE